MNLTRRIWLAFSSDAANRALAHQVAELTAERDQAVAERGELEAENARLTDIVDGVTAVAVHHEKRTGWLPTSALKDLINLDAQVAA